MLACIKFIVVLYNFLFWLLGVLILGLSAYLWWDSQNYLDIDEVSKYYITPFVVLLALGAIMTMVGFLGCCGAVRESRCFLGLYFLFCLTLCIACGASLYWTIYNENMVRDSIKLDTTKMIKHNYGTGNSNATEMLVDRMQRDLSCCGVKGPSDWMNSHYNNVTASAFELGISANLPEQGTYRIPQSCCQPGADNCLERVNRFSTRDVLSSIQGLNTVGCAEKVESFIRDKWALIVLVGCVLIGVQVFALLFACVLCCAISKYDDDK